MAYFLNKTIVAIPLILAILCLSCNFITSSKDFAIVGRCTGGSLKGNSAYRNNIVSLLSNLSSASSNSSSLPGFYNTTVGEFPDKAYGLYLCRGDLDTQLCHDCVVNVTDRALPTLNFNPECFWFDDQCMVSYANSSNFSDYKKGKILAYGGKGLNVPNYELYNMTLSTTLEGLVRDAALGNWMTKNFQTRVADVAGSDEKIYTLVQCAPDLSAFNCSSCLGELYARIPRCCNGTSGGDLIHANCMMKYNNQSFFSGANSDLSPNPNMINALRPPNLVVVYSVLFLFMYYNYLILY